MRGAGWNSTSLGSFTARQNQVTDSYRLSGRADYPKGSNKRVTSGPDMQAIGSPAAFLGGVRLTRNPLERTGY